MLMKKEPISKLNYSTKKPRLNRLVQCYEEIFPLKFIIFMFSNISSRFEHPSKLTL